MANKGSCESLNCWSDYWAGGVLTSLPDDFDSNYDGEIAAFWSEQFDSLANGASILDVCTGNGAIALLAAQAAFDSGKRFTIRALDGARVYPYRAARSDQHWNSLIKQIEFIEQTPFENFEGAGQTVDLIISQYGMEYCDWTPAALQCQRLLKNNGRLVIVSHSVNTDILQTMQQEHAGYQVLMKTGLTDTLNQALDAGQYDDQLSRTLAAIANQIQQVRMKKASPLLDYAYQLASQAKAMNAQQWTQYWDQMRSAAKQLEQGYARLHQMFSVHQRMLADQPWTDCFVEAGLVRLDQGSILYQGKHRIGDYHRLIKS